MTNVCKEEVLSGLLKNILGSQYIQYTPIYWPNIFYLFIAKKDLIYLFIYLLFFSFNVLSIY
jgi:hypothetical protein